MTFNLDDNTRIEGPTDDLIERLNMRVQEMEKKLATMTRAIVLMDDYYQVLIDVAT